jgi:sulfatase maturation enzyme AslB (radical SAM superfamily)
MTYDFDPDTNKAICLYPFSHAASHPTNERILCCVQSNEPVARGGTLEEYWNNDKMREIRRDMLAGKKRPECVTCYKQEERVGTSVRFNIGSSDRDLWWSRFSDTELATGHLERLPTDFDYRTMHCNLSCTHCGPHYSTTWQKELRDLNSLVEDGDRYMMNPAMAVKIDPEQEIIFGDELIQAIDDRRLEYIYWAGGEPMMSPMHWRVMDHLQEAYKVDPTWAKKVRVRYNTNLTRSTWKGINAYEYLSNLNVELSPSIDGVGPVFNYVRNGGNWDDVVVNWNHCMKHLKGTSVASVVTSLWIFDIDNFLDFFEPWNPMHMGQTLATWDKGNPWPPSFSSALDPGLFPAEIMIPAIDHAIARVNKMQNCYRHGFPNDWSKKKYLDILNVYKNEHEQKHKDLTEHRTDIKAMILQLEKLRSDSNTMSNVLRQVNTEAWLWWNAI